MKKFLSCFVLMIALFLMIGCSQSNCELVEHNDPNLNESMKNFYQDDVKSHVVGENFEAKIIAFDKVLKHDKNHGDIVEYKAIITVAPLCNQKIDIKDFKFSLSEEATKYYDAYPHMTGDDLLPLVKFGDGTTLKVTGINDMQAYRFDLLFDNAGTKNQLASNYSDEEFDEMVKDIKLIVYFDNDKEELNLSYADEINYYQNIDEIPNDRQDLKDLLDPNVKNHQTAGYYNASSWEEPILIGQGSIEIEVELDD